MDLLPARLPLEVELLGESNGGVVVRDDADGGGLGAGEADAVVDVEDAVGAAGRVDDRGGGDLVGLGVDLSLGPDASTGDGGLRRRGRRSVLREVVCRVEGAGDALVELSVAVVGALDDRELESTGVLEVQVELAVLGPLGRVEAGADISLEAVKAKGDDLFFGREELDYVSFLQRLVFLFTG